MTVRVTVTQSALRELKRLQRKGETLSETLVRLIRETGPPPDPSKPFPFKLKQVIKTRRKNGKTPKRSKAPRGKAGPRRLPRKT